MSTSVQDNFKSSGSTLEREKQAEHDLPNFDRAAENLGASLRESKQIANRLQDTVVNQQLQEHCEQRRKCLTCGKQRPVKDFRCRRLDTVLGTVRLRVPRYRRCQCRPWAGNSGDAGAAPMDQTPAVRKTGPSEMKVDGPRIPSRE